MKGNEGVEAKEGTLDNIIENNRIYMQLDVNSGGAPTAAAVQSICLSSNYNCPPRSVHLCVFLFRISTNQELSSVQTDNSARGA